MIYKKIFKSDIKGIKELSQFAALIEKEHYDPIIGSEQNDYMIKKFQSAEAIKEQIESGCQYYWVNDDSGAKTGFISFYSVEDKIYISKFYLQKKFRGKGISEDMLKFIVEETKKKKLKTIFLNVNKSNKMAISAYERMGFVKTRCEKISIGNGFFMDDYIYEYKI